MNNKRYYIGLASTFHDPALAIIDPDGNVIFAEATERFLQNKRAFNCQPDHMIRTPELINQYCEPDAELVVATSWSKAFLSRSNVYIKILPVLSRLFPRQWNTYNDLPRPSLKEYNMLISQRHSMGLAANNILGNSKISQKVIIKNYEHHLTHAAIACFTSPFSESACAIIDGFGEWKSCDFFHYSSGKIKRIKRFSLNPIESGSLGGFYGLVCVLCGFDAYKGEEGKVMGLAPYGQYDAELYQLMKPLVRVKDLYLRSDMVHQFLNSQRWQEIKRDAAVSPFEAADLAYTGQFIFEEVMGKLLENLYKRGLSDNLTLAGGCALNSTWNGKITQRTNFEKLYVPCAPGDDGSALGAALLAYYEDHPTNKPDHTFLSPYLGSVMSERKLGNLKKYGDIHKARVLDKQVYKLAASLLAEGKIIGWIQGRSEYGPRALGNRSILADPRPKDIVKRINAKVKFREAFRPFAPSILHEFGDEYFENYQESPYMERTLKFKDRVRHKVPGVVHVNNTGRLQTVKKEWIYDYYQLIKEFYDLTGIPLILNTSFNIMGKPIAHDVEDVISQFYTTGLDALFIDDYFLEK